MRAFDSAAELLRLSEAEHFFIEPCATCHVPGYLIVRPRVPVASFPEMSPAGLTALGPVLARATRAIEMVVQAERVYCALFAESERRLHFHLFPRTRWLADQYFAAHPHAAGLSGPLLLDWARRTFCEPIPGQNREEVNRTLRRLLAAKFV